MLILFLDKHQRRHDHLCLKTHSITNQRLVCSSNYAWVVHAFTFKEAARELAAEDYDIFSFDPELCFDEHGNFLISNAIFPELKPLPRFVLHGWDAAISLRACDNLLRLGYDFLLAPFYLP